MQQVSGAHSEGSAKLPYPSTGLNTSVTIHQCNFNGVSCAFNSYMYARLLSYSKRDKR